MPMHAGLQALPVATKITKSVLLIIGAVVLLAASPAQQTVDDEALERASEGRTVALGSTATGRRLATIPLEIYVARVLAGEADPTAPDAAMQALAVAIRTFAIVNVRRHSRLGFDLCDTTHCQVLRAANATTRRAAMASAGRVLTYEGVPAEVFYSASCGGRSETASEVWPDMKLPYLRSLPDNVHDEDVPWTLELTLEQIQSALERAGFGGRRLTGVEIEERNSSGRVARLRLDGLRPGSVRGEPFRAAIGYRDLRSTLFSMEKDGNVVRFTGRGYGHGVGMCAVGAGRRARRGESFEEILEQYYPGLDLTPLDRITRPRK